MKEEIWKEPFYCDGCKHQIKLAYPRTNTPGWFQYSRCMLPGGPGPFDHSDILRMGVDGIECGKKEVE